MQIESTDTKINAMQIQKHDMVGTHYKWDGLPGDTLFSGVPTRRLFDRYNGEQVLFLINFYASMSDGFTLQEARRIEHLISDFLPMDAKSEISVFNWIRNMPRVMER